MAEFTGTISYEGTAPSLELVMYAKRCAYDTRVLKETAQLPRLTKAYEAIDGSQVYVLDYEHVWRVHVVPAISQEDLEHVLPEPYSVYGAPTIPLADFVSGATPSTSYKTQQVHWLYPNELPEDMPESGTYPVAVIPDGGLSPETSKRFSKSEVGFKIAVPPYRPFLSPDAAMQPVTQLEVIRPGRYTGAMAPMVQLLLGVGYQMKPSAEERWRKEGSNRGAVAAEPTGWVYDDDEGVGRYEYDPPESAYKAWGAKQLSYDPRWNRTHGIMWGLSNKGERVPMLVELGQRGVHVMEFPVDPPSKIKEVQEQYEKVHPGLAKYRPFRGGAETLFEAFDGFPTGENFPATNDDMQRWVRSGRVVDLPGELDDFYADTNAVCTYHGWAFHPTAPRAAIVGYRMEAGRKVGVCYEAILEITEKTEQAKVRNPLAETLITALGLTTIVDRCKAERITEAEAEALIAEPDKDAFDALTATSDWQVSVRLTKVKSGFIDYPAYQCNKLDPCDIIYSPQFKYMEPLIGEVTNFFFENLDLEPDVESDGPIFVTYTSRGLDILNYAYEFPSMKQIMGSTRAPCQYTGRWISGPESRSSGMKGYFYSSTKDFRKDMSEESSYVTTYTGHRTGYDDFMSFCAFFAMHAMLRRRYWGYQTYEGEIVRSKRHYASIMCAAHERSVYFVCVEDQRQAVQYTSGQTRHEIIGQSGAVSYGHLFQFTAHWTGVCKPKDYPDCTADPVCRLVVCDQKVIDPESCFGTAPPSDPGYQVCPERSRLKEDESPVSTFDGQTTDGYNVYYSAAYNKSYSSPGPAWSETTDPQWEFEWEVYGMGHDLMNGLKLHRVEEIIDDPEAVPIFSSDTQWWKCSVIGMCSSPPYYCAINHYGKPSISAYTDPSMSKVETIGAKLTTAFGPMSIPFGVVE